MTNEIEDDGTCTVYDLRTELGSPYEIIDLSKIVKNLNQKKGFYIQVNTEVPNDE